MTPPRDSRSSLERVRVSGAGRFLALPGLSGQTIRTLIDAHDATRDDARVLKARFGTRVTHVSLPPTSSEATQLGTAEVVVKEGRVAPRHALAQALGRRSRVHRDFAQERRLQERGVSTPRVLACTLRSEGRSEYELTQLLEGAHTLRRLLWLDGGVLTAPEDRARLVASLGPWIRHLHDAGIWQRDLKAHNIMVRGESDARPELHLLDITFLRFRSGPLSRARRIRNLAQVLDVPAHLDEELGEPLLSAYLGDAAEAARWLPEVRAGVEARRRARLRKDGFRFIDERILSKN